MTMVVFSKLTGDTLPVVLAPRPTDCVQTTWREWTLSWNKKGSTRLFSLNTDWVPSNLLVIVSWVLVFVANVVRDDYPRDSLFVIVLACDVLVKLVLYLMIF